jgi:hypothetical protein
MPSQMLTPEIRVANTPRIEMKKEMIQEEKLQ